MSDQPLTDPGPAPPLGESRSRVLEVLRGADGPIGVQEVAARTGLHPNTARFHLDGLVEAGLAGREPEERDQPGRPRMVYHAVAEGGDGQRSYRLLARMLTGIVAGMPHPERAAAEAGEAWGRYLAERPEPLRRVDAEEGIRRLTKVMRDIGFAPDASSDGENAVVALRHCPFREVAAEHREVVCSLHLGLMRGVLAEVRAPLTAQRLEPFAEPSLCLAHLGPPARPPASEDRSAEPAPAPPAASPDVPGEEAEAGE